MASTASGIVPFPSTQHAYYNNNTQEGINPKQDYYYNNNIISDVAHKYTECFGRPMPPNIAAQVTRLVTENHVEPQMICDVMDYATEAPVPSWRYARAVINAKIKDGITTAAAWQRSLAGWSGTPGGYAQPKHKKNLERDYEQRSYDPATYDGLSKRQLDYLAEMNKLIYPAKIPDDYFTETLNPDAE